MYDVQASCGIKVPNTPGVAIKRPFTVFLDNKGGIKNVIKVGDAFYGDEVNSACKGIPSRFPSLENDI